MSEEDSSGGPSLPPGVLKQIMDEGRQADGSRWTPVAVSRALAERGLTVSRQYLSRLANEGGHPRWGLVLSMAELFDVSTDAFRGRDSALAGLVYRAGSLSEDKQQDLQRYVAYLEFQQGKEP